MARSTFSGPVKSDNGFEGNVVGNVTGDVTGVVDATDLSASGTVILSALPTTNPAVAGQLWNDAGTLKVSAG